MEIGVLNGMDSQAKAQSSRMALDSYFSSLASLREIYRTIRADACLMKIGVLTPAATIAYGPDCIEKSYDVLYVYGAGVVALSCHR